MDGGLDVADMIAPTLVGLEQYRPLMRYLLIDENCLWQVDLALDRNLVAALFRLERSRTPEGIQAVVRELTEWLKTPAQTSLRRAFAVWLGRVLLPKRLPGQVIPEVSDLQEVDAMLAETVQECTKEWEAQGLEKGLLEGEANILRRLLCKKFGGPPLPSQVEKTLANATLGEIEIWADRILDARSRDDVFGE